MASGDRVRGRLRAGDRGWGAGGGLAAAAGAFGDSTRVDDDRFEWVEIETKRPLRPGLFVARVDGRSMEPTIPDGSYNLFAAPVVGRPQGRIVLAELRDPLDPETGRYTVKRFAAAQDAPNPEVRLEPLNRDFKSLNLTGESAEHLALIAEWLEVLSE